jgi:tetratricopeptide (TPR) repeat protein
MEVGRWSDAAAVLQSATRRNPSSPMLRYKLIVSLWSSGRISAAEGEIERAMRLWPQHGAIWQTKIKLLALTGRAKEALALASDPAAKPLEERDAPNHASRLLFVKALATRASADVERALDSILREAREVELDRVTLGLQSGVLGRTDLALEMLEGVYLRRGEWRTERPYLGTHPLFQPHARTLWPQPRFKAIVDAIGLERYWQSARVPPDYRKAS